MIKDNKNEERETGLYQEACHWCKIGVNTEAMVEGKGACHRSRLGGEQKGNWGHWWKVVNSGKGIGFGILFT